MTQHHHSRSKHTSNGVTSQAESSQVLPGAVDNLARFAEEAEQEEQAKAATEGTSSGPHCSNADRLHSKDSGKTRGSASGITDPQKLQVVSCGIDNLKLSCTGKPVNSALLARLAVLQAEAKEGGEPLIDIAGRVWQVKPHGNRAKGSGYLRYCLRSGSVVLYLGDRDSGQVASIEAEGQHCGGRCPQEIHRELKNIVGRAGVVPSDKGFTVTRVDLYADQAGVSMQAVHAIHAARNSVFLATKVETHEAHNRVTGIEVGKRTSGVYLRMYDKHEELKQDPQKAEFYRARNDLDSVPSVLTRVEFELGWEKLKELGCENSDDVFESLSNISEYLMVSWYRPCHHVDRRHTDRAKAVAWWQRLQVHLAARCKGFVAKVRKPKTEPQIARIKRQALAFVAGVFGKLGQVPATLHDAMTGFADMCSSDDFRWLMDRIETRVLQSDQNRLDWSNWAAASEAAAS